MLLILLLILKVLQSHGYSTMLKVFGRIPYQDLSINGTDLSMNECIDDCYSNPDCILAYMDSSNHCVLYNYSILLILNVTETSKSDGFYVAFKVNLPSATCPASYDSISFCGSTASDSYCWNRTSTGWLITNTCPEPWKKFERADSVTVCMRAFRAQMGISKEDAAELCESQGYKLTGVASDEESDWMRNEILRLEPGDDYAYWLDGRRTDECQLNRCNDFIWTDGYTTGNAAILNKNFSRMSFVGDEDYPEQYLTSHATRGTWDYTLNDVPDDYGWSNGLFCGFRVLN